MEARIYGRFIGPGGELLGDEFVIYEASTDFDEFYCPSLRYDGVYGRFLVVWSANWNKSNTYAQLVNADGTPSGPVRVLSNAANSCSAVAYDGAQSVFLALWGEQNGSLYAQLIGTDGSLTGSKFLVSNNAEQAPSVAYDSGNQRFLAAWSSADFLSIQGRIVNPDGSFLAPEFSIYAAAGNQSRPTIAYDSINSRFLAAWEHTEGGDYSLLGQVLNADGSLYQTAFTISSAGIDVNNHALTYDPVGQEYFAVFADNKSKKIYSQLVTAQGVLDTTVSNDNLLLSYQNYPGDDEPTIAYDSANRRYLASWSYLADGQINKDIHGRIVNSDGTPLGDIFVLSNGGAW